MGTLCDTSNRGNSNPNNTSKIDKKSKEDARHEQRQIKLLLVGCGSAGKSTLFKSLQISHAGGILHTDLVSVVPIIRRHAVEAIIRLCQQTEILYTRNPDLHSDCQLIITPQVEENVQLIYAFKNDYVLDGEMEEWKIVDDDKLNQLVNAIDFIWNLAPIQATYRKRGRNFAFEDNLDYYLNKIQTIMQPNYIATQQDYLKAKQRTAGMFLLFVFLCFDCP